MIPDPPSLDPSPFAKELPCPRCGRLSVLLRVDARLLLAPTTVLGMLVPEARYQCSRRRWPHRFGRRLPGTEPAPDGDTYGLEPVVVGWERTACVMAIVAIIVLDGLVGGLPGLLQFALALVMIACAIIGLLYPLD